MPAVKGDIQVHRSREKEDEIVHRLSLWEIMAEFYFLPSAFLLFLNFLQ